MIGAKGNVVFIVGPTASGKSALGLLLCSLVDGEIVNADAMQMYKGAPIATNQPSDEEMAATKHHLVAVKSATEQIVVQDFVRMAVQAIEDIHSRGKTAVVVGGTCYYIMALFFKDWVIEKEKDELIGMVVDDLKSDRNDDTELLAMSDEEKPSDPFDLLSKLDPVSASRLDRHDDRKVRRALELAMSGNSQTDIFASQQTRPRFDDSFVVVLEASGADFEAAIATRVDAMFERGLLQEKEALQAQFETIDCERGIWQSIGLKELLSGGRDQVVRATVRYAKKQTRQLRNSLCPLIRHLPLPAAACTSAAPDIVKWIQSGDAGNLQVREPQFQSRAEKQVERIECCGKTITGAQCIQQHRKSKLHKAKMKQMKK